MFEILKSPAAQHYFAEQHRLREERLAREEQSEATLSKIFEEQERLAFSLGLTCEELTAATQDPAFREIYGIVLDELREGNTISYDEARCRFESRQEELDVRVDKPMDRINREVQSRHPFGQKYLSKVERKKIVRNYPTKLQLCANPRTIQKLRARVAEKEARRTRATASKEEIAAAINVEEGS